MANSTGLANKWKIKHILSNGSWIPKKGDQDRVLFGDYSSVRLKNALLCRFKFANSLKSGPYSKNRLTIDQSYIYEVGEHGKLIATYNENINVFLLDN